ncbi:hypothetical protein EU519_01240 [Candidatus Thorarchaeota archaeon]|nr:MAG: hypothetical protein EU519_01240 [Candidatus Thorarchaeota archaeon]
MNEIAVTLLVYALAGLTLKVGDDLLDEMSRPGPSWFPLALSGVLFGFLMSRSEWDLALLVSILLGVLASGKVNHPQFGIGFIMIACVLLLRGVPNITDIYLWIALLLVLFLASALDEKGNDWADTYGTARASWFFRYRLTLKVVGLLVSLLWSGFLIAAIGIWVFDLGYEIAGRLTRKYYV